MTIRARRRKRYAPHPGTALAGRACAPCDRPDLFKNGGRKYTDEELAAILADDTRPVLAAVDENDRLLGYASACWRSATAATS